MVGLLILRSGPELRKRQRTAALAADRQVRNVCFRSAFTLVELMIVVAIIGMVLTIAVPTIYRYFNPDSLNGTVRSFMEACSHARAHAILNGVYTELIINPAGRSFSVAVGSSATPNPEPERLESLSVSGEEWRMEDRAKAAPTSGGIFSGKISEKLIIHMVDVNFVEHKDLPSARVRFYPNGTSDEFTLILQDPENDQWRKISLEVVTALADLSSDPQKWK
jgi:prepilin-type N-terminal cleavage/methylation domain-containing protein